MTVSGFSIIRNALRYGYPVVEAVTSILPICDEFILNVGASDDDTLDLVRTISSPKLRVIERTWDLGLRYGGHLISRETNAALQECRGTWCFYIQADEVLHERYLPVVTAAMGRFENDTRVEGLQFAYRHFYGSFDYYQDNYRRWYVREGRVIRRDENIISWGDGLNFTHRDGSRIRLKRIDAEIYHYGYVRPPAVMFDKSRAFNALYHSDEEVERIVPAGAPSYTELGHLKRFTGTHPAVMRDRIRVSRWAFDAKIEDQPPDWWRHVLLFLHPVTKRVKRLLRRGRM